MGFVTTFDLAGWQALYPVFAKVTLAPASGYFGLAGIYWRNDGTSLARTQGLQDQLMYLLTSHIAWLSSMRDAAGLPDSAGTQPPSSIVGRISSATEGSVTVQSENDYPPGSAQWFQQTTYGAMFWQATAAFRTARYAPPCPNPLFRTAPYAYPWRP